MAKTRSETIREATEDYLKSILSGSGPPPPPDQIQADIIAVVNRDIEIENHQKPPGQKWKYINELSPPIIATVMLYLHPVVFLSCRMSNDCGILALRQDNGGQDIYRTDSTEITKIIRQYGYNLSDRAIRETLAHLRDQADRIYLDCDPELIPAARSSIIRGLVPKELIVDMLLMTDEIRILKSMGSSEERLIARHYAECVRSGIWEIVNNTDPDKNYGTLGTS